MNMILVCGSSPAVEDMCTFLRDTGKFGVQMFTHGLEMAEGVVAAMHPQLLIVNIANMIDSSYSALNRISAEESHINVLAMGNAAEYNVFKTKFTSGQAEFLTSPFQKREGLAQICRALGVPFSEMKDVIPPDTGAMGGMGMGMGSQMGGMDMSGMGGMDMSGMGMGGPMGMPGMDMPGMGMHGSSDIANYNSAKPIVMVIDDNAMTLRSMKGLLEDEYNVMIANSGPKAFKMMERGIPNIILLDYEMPEMDGRMVLQMLRSNPMFASIPVIFLTGVNDRDHISAALALRPSGYLLKPVAKARLLSTIEATLQAEINLASGMSHDGLMDPGNLPFV